MNKLLIILLFCAINTIGQTTYNSSRGYSITIPAGFVKTEATNTDIDLMTKDPKDAKLIVACKALPPEAVAAGIDEMNTITVTEWREQLMQKNLTNVDIMEKGMTKLGSRRAFYLMYAASSLLNREVYNFMVYQVIKNGKLISITTGCKKNTWKIYKQIFENAIRSFK
jgi:hypothetical protein